MNAPARPHVVIIGGGFGGLETAKSLRKAPVRVTLIDRSNHHLFQPLLYQVATAGLSPADIASPIRSVLRKQANTQVLLAEVVAIALEDKHLTLGDGSRVDYDFLVLAAGAKTNDFGNKNGQEHALGLKDLDDAVAIRRQVLLALEAAENEPDPEVRRRLLTFAVIGAGPTGVEVAGALAELSRSVLTSDFRNIRGESPRVVLLEGEQRVLMAFRPDVSAKAQRQLEELGVEVRTGARVARIDKVGVYLEGGEWIESTTVLWTAGVKARRITQTLGTPLDRAGRAVVEPDWSLPGHPTAFAIGDNAHFLPEGEDHPLPGVSPVAMQGGRFVARRITDLVRARETRTEPPPAPKFHYRDKGIMATVGRSRAVTQTRRTELSGTVAWFAWLFVHIWYLIGFRNRLVVLFSWMWNYFTYRRGARLITGARSWERAITLAETAENAEDPSERSSGAA